MRLEGSEFPERPKADPALPPEMLRYVKGLRLHEGILPVLYRAKSLFGQEARLESVHMEVPLPERTDLHTITLDQFAVNVLTEKRHVDIFHLLIGDFVWVCMKVHRTVVTVNRNRLNSDVDHKSTAEFVHNGAFSPASAGLYAIRLRTDTNRVQPLIIDSAYGAGKSLCTALIAIEAVQRGKVVLIAAVQNTALDVICAKLAQMDTPDVRPVRYVSETLARDAIRSGLYDLASLMEHMPQIHAEKMDDYEKNAFSASADPRRRLRESIFSGVERTLMASEHKTLLSLEQANSERIKTLMTRFPDATYNLVGDSNQLPPYIGTQRAPLAVTLFSRSVLDVARRVGNPPTCKISTVYRPHPNMMELNPRIFYNGELVCGTTKEARLALLNRVWMLNPDLPIAFINIIGESVQSVTGSQNPVEARQLPPSFDSF
ncbi:hypothetical protein OSTOST_02387 [Ostertagia ostertagi]